MPFDKVAPLKPRTLRDEAADRLRSAIRGGTIPVGARLVEQELAAQLGVSRVPVREAIQMLVDEGLVRKAPRRGAYVYLPTYQEIDEICSLRVMLERFIVERAIANWNADHEAALRSVVAQMRAASDSGDYQALYEQDYNFHLTLWRLADHSILLEVVSSLRSRISRFLYEANSALSSAPANTHVDSHDDLIDILSSGDVAAAIEAITDHILDAKKRILTHCRLETDAHDV